MCMKFLRNTGHYVKMAIVLAVVFMIAIVSEVIHFHESRYIGVIFFGYMCHRFWGEDKPDVELAQVWGVFKPFLFGTVGAAVKLNEVDSGVLGKGFLIILVGVSCRMLATFLSAFERRFTFKERVFMAFAWIPKATVQAAIGGVVLDQARDEGDAGEEYVQFGRNIVTIAVLAIVVTAPAGAILTNTFGPLWL